MQGIIAVALHGYFRARGRWREYEERHADEERGHDQKQGPSDRMQAAVAAAEKAGWDIRHCLAPDDTEQSPGAGFGLVR
jgi:hypothetical protein